MKAPYYVQDCASKKIPLYFAQAPHTEWSRDSFEAWVRSFDPSVSKANINRDFGNAVKRISEREFPEIPSHVRRRCLSLFPKKSLKRRLQHHADRVQAEHLRLQEEDLKTDIIGRRIFGGELLRQSKWRDVNLEGLTTPRVAAVEDEPTVIPSNVSNASVVSVEFQQR